MYNPTPNMKHCKAGWIIVHKRMQRVWSVRSSQWTKHCLKMEMLWSINRRNVQIIRDNNISSNSRCFLCSIDRWLIPWCSSSSRIESIPISICLESHSRWCRCHPWWIWSRWCSSSRIRWSSSSRLINIRLSQISSQI